MSSDVKNKRIYTLNRLFAICVVLFSVFYASNAQLVAQVISSGEAEVLELNWISSNQDLSSIEIAEFQINSRWTGVEILESDYVWVEYLGETPESFQTEFAIKRPEWRVVRGANSNEFYAQHKMPAFKVEDGQLYKLESWTGIVASSPLLPSRIERDWPEHSELSEGSWIKFATTKEGLHRIEGGDFIASGVDPDTIDFSTVAVYGGGGRALPFANSEDRPLDLPLVPIKVDGSTLFFHATGVDSWSYDYGDEKWEHEKHPWSDTAFYYVRLNAPEFIEGSRITEANEVDLPVTESIEKHVARMFHEVENVNLAHSGREFYNEHFTYLGSQFFSFYFNVPNLTGDTGIVESRIAGRTLGTTSTFNMDCVGETYTTEDIALSENSLLIAAKRNLSIEAPMSGVGVSVEMTFEPGNTEAEGWIDFVRLQVPQELKFYGGQFHINGTTEINEGEACEYLLSEADDVDGVWDITDPLTPKICSVEGIGSDELSWQALRDTTRRFVAFRFSAAHGVEARGSVQNVDLHSLKDIDLVIMTSPLLDSAAHRLATLHSNEGMRVAVVNQREVWDCFSSGSPDPTALKMLMLMLRDKAESPEDEPKHLLLMGDGSYLNRNLPADGMDLLTYQSLNSESTVSSYVTDDYFGLLEDDFSDAPGDKLAIGVGRIPAPSLSDALAVVSKIENYLGAPIDSLGVGSCVGDDESSTFGEWRNKILFVTDDQDGNNNDGWRHMSDSEVHSDHVAENYNEYDIIKIYPDAYVQEATPGGERYDEAEAEIQRKVEEGALIVDYIGHGGSRGWAHERILNTTTIREWTNKNRLPVFMTATCELSRYDDPEVESAGEMLVFNPNGGAVGSLTTTRTVFSGGNQELNTAFFQTVLDEDEGTGLMRCLGDICKDTKNSPEVTSTVNMRNFSLLGDPAMMLAYPSHKVFFTEVPDTIKSLDLVTISGFVGDENGEVLEDFNGFIYPKVFDKRSYLNTLDNDDVAGSFSYSMFRNVIHKGLASVENGEFTFQFVVPRDIDYSYGNGRISCYALSGEIDAHGSSEDFIIGGTSDSVVPDDEGPDVDLYMNDELFERGGITSDDPWLYARVFDESGINTVGNGIGHDLKAVLDGEYDSPFILNSYFSADLDTYKSGTVRFPFKDLEEGEHQLILKVWDVQNNSATDTTEFIVVNSLEVALTEVIAYPNPAYDEATFRFSHNQECNAIEARIDIYDSEGRFVSTYETDMHAHGSRTDLYTWDLTNSAGATVKDGLYVFKIQLKALNGTTTQYGSRLVVVRP